MTNDDAPDRMEGMWDYGELQAGLQVVLASAWFQCEDRDDWGDFAEFVSMALGGAAKRIAVARFAQVVYGAGGLDHEAACAILVKQRPGSWESAALSQLVGDADLTDTEWEALAERAIAEVVSDADGSI